MPRSGRRRRSPRTVTLSSDLGAAYAAQLKAVLAHAIPPGQIVDLAHDLRPHDIAEAGFVVRAMAQRFPAGTIHLVVVDPGVGGRRAPIVVACPDGSRVVGPDNGVLVPLIDALGGGRAYRLRPERLRGVRRVGTTFDGRDVFAPAAARLARGARPSTLGSPTSVTRPPGEGLRRRPGGADGSVAHVDRFGNLITNVPTAWVPRGTRQVLGRVGGRVRRLRLVRSYEAAEDGELVVLGSSFGTLELALPRGRGAERLGARVGSRIAFDWRAAGRRSARNRKKATS